MLDVICGYRGNLDLVSEKRANFKYIEIPEDTELLTQLRLAAAAANTSSFYYVEPNFVLIGDIFPQLDSNFINVYQTTHHINYANPVLNDLSTTKITNNKVTFYGGAYACTKEILKNISALDGNIKFNEIFFASPAAPPTVIIVDSENIDIELPTLIRDEYDFSLDLHQSLGEVASYFTNDWNNKELIFLDLKDKPHQNFFSILRDETYLSIREHHNLCYVANLDNQNFNNMSKNVTVQRLHVNSLHLPLYDLDVKPTVFVLLYDEPTYQAETTVNLLNDHNIKVELITGVKGIYEAHYECAKRSKSPWFFVIDADLDISSDIVTLIKNYNCKFNSYDHNFEFDKIYVWPCTDELTGLVYGHGGAKLMHASNFIRKPDSYLDMTSALGEIKVQPEMLGKTVYLSEFLTWRAGLREATKLKTWLIGNPEDNQAISRLNAWLNPVKADNKFSAWLKAGAEYGVKLALAYDGNKEILAKLINDYDVVDKLFDMMKGNIR